MSSDSSHEPADNVNYERRDVHITALVGFFTFLMVFMVAAVVIGVGLHKGYLHIERSRKVDMSPLANMRPVPPEPRLQVDPTKDLVHFKAMEQQTLTTYAWIDADQGVVRLPIERAKELLLERGL